MTTESDEPSALPVGQELLALTNKWTFLLHDYAAAEDRISNGVSAARPLPKGMNAGETLEQYRDRCWNVLSPVNERLRIAAAHRHIASSPLRDLIWPWKVELWKPAMETVDELTAIAIVEIERQKSATVRHEDFASWGPADIRMSTLPPHLADAFESIHRAAYQAAWVHYIVGSGDYKKQPIEDAKKFEDKLRSFDLPKARSYFKVVEAELIAVRQQTPCAHAAALRYAEEVAAAATVRTPELEWSIEEKWQAIHNRLKSMPALNGTDTTNAMKIEAVDAAKSREKLSPAAPSHLESFTATAHSGIVEPEPVLDEKDVKILRELQRYIHTIMLADLEAKVNLNRDTCTEHVEYLIKLGYLARKSERSGVAITEKGRTRLNRQNG